MLGWGTQIVFVQGDWQYILMIDLGNLAYSSIWLAPASGGPAHRVTADRSMHMSPAWASERSLLFVSDQDGGRDAYELSLSGDGSPRGAPVRITTGLIVAHGCEQVERKPTEALPAWEAGRG